MSKKWIKIINSNLCSKKKVPEVAWGDPAQRELGGRKAVLASPNAKVSAETRLVSRYLSRCWSAVLQTHQKVLWFALFYFQQFQNLSFIFFNRLEGKQNLYLMFLSTQKWKLYKWHFVSSKIIMYLVTSLNIYQTSHFQKYIPTTSFF